MNETIGPVLLTVQEAADLLRFTKRRVYDLLREGQLDAFQLLEPNGEWRIRCDSEGLPRFVRRGG